MRVAGLFAGIGGLELGLRSSGFHPEVLCEIEPHAQRVLRTQFDGVPIEADVAKMKSLPHVELLTAGFPCQDLSQAGAKAGITGEKSGLVSHLLRLVSNARPRPKWLLIENVSYMLRLDRGQAMRFLTTALEDLGYRWAYRVVDARSFGVPQRRLRVILLASREGDPRNILFADNVSDPEIVTHRLQGPLVVDQFGPNIVEQSAQKSYGFYWTEGRIGIGWAVDAVPTIKGGSGLGIPSPPAVWFPDTNALGLPSIADGERLQGLPSGWTLGASDSGRAAGIRWKLVGNAVCAPVAEWVGKRLVNPGRYCSSSEDELPRGSWPMAAYGQKGHEPRSVKLSAWPILSDGKKLRSFLLDPLKPLSERAAAGFVSRARLSEKINYAPEFLSALDQHIESFQ